MIEAHGSVPFFDDLADVNDPNLMRGQMPFDEMVDWIDAQLVDLSKKLPASYLNESTHFMAVPLPSCVWRFVPVSCSLLQVRWPMGTSGMQVSKIMMVNSGSAKLTILQNGNVPLMLTGS